MSSIPGQLEIHRENLFEKKNKERASITKCGNTQSFNPSTREEEVSGFLWVLCQHDLLKSSMKARDTKRKPV